MESKKVKKHTHPHIYGNLIYDLRGITNQWIKDENI